MGKDDVSLGGLGALRMTCVLVGSVSKDDVSFGGLGVEGADGGDDGLLLVVAEFGVEGEREDFGGGAFGFGEVAGVVPEEAKRGLQMQRQGVVDLGADALGGEVGAEFVSSRGADDVLVKDVLGAGMSVGKDESVLDGFGVLG